MCSSLGKQTSRNRSERKRNAFGFYLVTGSLSSYLCGFWNVTDLLKGCKHVRDVWPVTCEGFSAPCHCSGGKGCHRGETYKTKVMTCCLHKKTNIKVKFFILV